MQRARQLGGQGHSPEGGRLLHVAGLQIPVEPPIGSAFHPGRRALHVVLGVEVRPCRVGRSAGVNHGQLTAIPEPLERRQTRVEPEEAVEIDRAILRGGRADGNRRPRASVLVIAERDHEAEGVYSAPLEDRDESFRPRRACRPHRAPQKRGCKPEADECERSVLQEDSSGDHVLLQHWTAALQRR